MRPLLSFRHGAFVLHLGAVERDLHNVGPAIVARACEMVCEAAKKAIGKEHEMWPALSPSTIADKMRHGWPTPSPLLRSGALRDSISWTSEGLEGAVGSDSEIAVWQELGTSRMPPRSFLASSAHSMEDQIHKMAARAVVSVLCGRGLYSSELGELIHLLRHAAHQVKEDLPLLENDEDDDRRRR
jgi:hypothetical protein